MELIEKNLGILHLYSLVQKLHRYMKVRKKSDMFGPNKNVIKCVLLAGTRNMISS